MTMLPRGTDLGVSPYAQSWGAPAVPVYLQKSLVIDVRRESGDAWMWYFSWPLKVSYDRVLANFGMNHYRLIPVRL